MGCSNSREFEIEDATLNPKMLEEDALARIHADMTMWTKLKCRLQLRPDWEEWLFPVVDWQNNKMFHYCSNMGGTLPLSRMVRKRGSHDLSTADLGLLGIVSEPDSMRKICDASGETVLRFVSTSRLYASGRLLKANNETLFVTQDKGGNPRWLRVIDKDTGEVKYTAAGHYTAEARTARTTRVFEGDASKYRDYSHPKVVGLLEDSLLAVANFPPLSAENDRSVQIRLKAWVDGDIEQLAVRIFLLLVFTEWSAAPPRHRPIPTPHRRARRRRSAAPPRHRPITHLQVGAQQARPPDAHAGEADALPRAHRPEAVQQLGREQVGSADQSAVRRE